MESFTFSTKERVPYLVCLEVVDYARDDYTDPTDQSNGDKSTASFWPLRMPNMPPITMPVSQSVSQSASQSTS